MPFRLKGSLLKEKNLGNIALAYAATETCGRSVQYILS
jgi:hypothetical protein